MVVGDEERMEFGFRIIGSFIMGTWEAEDEQAALQEIANAYGLRKYDIEIWDKFGGEAWDGGG